MAKRKRKRDIYDKYDEFERNFSRNFSRTKRPYFANLGFPEVDGIIKRLQFEVENNNDKVSSPTSSKKRSLKKELIKFKLGRHNDLKEKDVISKLPDDILGFIVSSLSTREGAATCILSRRWRSLWINSVSRLNFDIPTMTGGNYHKAMFLDKDKCLHRLLKKKRYEFTKWVDRVLRLRSASTRLDSLRVCFVLDQGSAFCIDRWVKSAIAQGVTDVELDFNIRQFYFRDIRLCHSYQFPTRENAPSLKHLRLKSCIFHLPRDFTGFASLISLSLGLIEVSQQLVDNILSNCPLLEFLSLVRCYYDTRTLKFSGSSLLLKHLHMVESGNIEKIEVHDINLISLELFDTDYTPKLSLKNAPHLARLVLLGHIRIETLSNVPRLETLFLTAQYTTTDGVISRSRIILPPSCVFSNLKRLVSANRGLATRFLEVIDLLEICPSLQELELQMLPSPTWEEEVTETMSKLATLHQIHHNNLKEVEIYGFVACERIIAFAKYLLKYAAVLEKMKISTTRKVYRGNGNWTLHEGMTKEKSEKHLKKVHKQLQKVVPSSTKLEIFSKRYNFKIL